MSDDDMDHEYFESMYRNRPDPWDFDTSFYERRKFDLTLASLTRPRYRSAFEPGCSNGALTIRLAERTDHLTSCDIVDSVVDRARERVRHLDHVRVLGASFPEFWPDRESDLVVWSEIAYYLAEASLASALHRLDEHLSTDGELVVVNYTGDTNYPRTADEVDAQIESYGSFARRASLRDESFRLDVWRR
ncbi:MAG: SAM-dependent methyltransferase [Ilumatobacter sp.]|uniref:SAM-dependent methyltransferase n=1 Tax=Ilumatobacter sp. TaxID=1967498 RepID=UPI003297D6D8